jgi:hypothetical protein
MESTDRDPDALPEPEPGAWDERNGPELDPVAAEAAMDREVLGHAKAPRAPGIDR